MNDGRMLRSHQEPEAGYEFTKPVSHLQLEAKTKLVLLSLLLFVGW